MAEVSEESDLIKALGITDLNAAKDADDSEGVEESYDVVAAPESEAVDLSELRGVADHTPRNAKGEGSETELDNLAELVPGIKNRARSASYESVVDVDEEELVDPEQKEIVEKQLRKLSVVPSAKSVKDQEEAPPGISKEPDPSGDDYQAEDEASSGEPRCMSTDDSLDDYPDSDLALKDDFDEDKVPKEFINASSAQSLAPSISTATQTHEVRMPMYLPTFKPATGCTNASDFIVRCFVARLRSGITVVKHGRSRWCKSRLRVLHIHPDGRSLSWRPAEGEPPSSRRPPKLDLATCLEVRHAWSPDPQNPMYTGTPILRQKCEAANAHKSFALIFKARTVDITAVTADQCKVLMEGFSALCFRLQVAKLAERGAKKGHARPMPEDDGLSTTASATLTNNSGR
jgi:hypothetical protein